MTDGRQERASQLDASPDATLPTPSRATPKTSVRWSRSDTIVTIIGLLTVPAVVIANLISGQPNEAMVDAAAALGLFVIWWVAFFGVRVLDDVLQRNAERDDENAINADPEKIISPAGNARTLDASVEALTAYIDRLETKIDRMEKTAAFVPGAIGVVASIALARLNPDVAGVALYLGIIAVGLGMRALTDATLCLTQYRSIGMSGYGELWRVDRSYEAFQAGRISMLIAGVRYASRAAAEKRRRLRMAVAATVFGVVFLYGFAVFGGFA